MMAPPHLSEGTFTDGASWLRAGQGPNLFMSLGLTPTHDRLRGLWRRLALQSMRAYIPEFTTWIVTRPTRVPPKADMSWLAASLVRNIETVSSGPIALLGMSTGGSVALQAAVEKPDMVGTLVVTDGAARLTDWGRSVQSRLADDLESGAQRRGWLRFLQRTEGRCRGAAIASIGCLLPNGLLTANPSDAIATLRAESAFDCRLNLASITAKTLLVGGAEDRLYGPKPMVETAAEIPHCRSRFLAGAGHGVALRNEVQSMVISFLRSNRTI